MEIPNETVPLSKEEEELWLWHDYYEKAEKEEEEKFYLQHPHLDSQPQNRRADT